MASLPKRPERSAPIPNDPFNSPEVSSIRGPYWDMPLGAGLESDPYGSAQIAGSEPSEPTAMLYGPNGFVGVGSGLQIGSNGEFETSGPYIYCTPQYGNLPVSYPPYGCETEVNTAGVTDFTDAWYDCQEITEFPCVDSSAVTDFSGAWEYCYGLTSFPTINTSSGETFFATWQGCYNLTEFPKLNFSTSVNLEQTWDSCQGLISFPTINVSNVTNFNGTWQFCTSLTSFPLLDVSSGTDFSGTWQFCTSLVTFPAGVFDICSATNFAYAWRNCALSQQSVDNILISIDTAGQSNGVVNIDGGTSSAPGTTGLAAKASLQARGWTVLTN